MKEDFDLIGIAVYDTNGVLVELIAADTAHNKSFPVQMKSITNPDSANVILWFEDIVQKEHDKAIKIGSLVKMISLDRIHEQIEDSRESIIVLSCIIFILGIIAVFRITSLIANPLNILTDTFAKISEGDLDKRAEYNAKDEFGILAGAFNSMVDKLAHAHKELEDLNLNLERLVKIRTSALEKEIKERKEASKLLLQSKQTLQIIIDTMPIGICLLDRNGCILQANSSASIISGVNEIDELTGRNFADFVISGTDENTGGRKIKLNESEYLFKNVKNDIIPVILHEVEVLIDKQPMMIKAFLDISKRKENEEKIRINEERLRNLYENAPVGIYRSTPEGRFIMANPALLKILGYDTVDELKNIDIIKDGYVFPDERYKFVNHLNLHGKIINNEVYWKKKDGTEILISESGRAVYDYDGKVKYYEGFLEDITKRKFAEEQIINMNKELEKRVEERTNQLKEVLQDVQLAKDEVAASLDKEKDLNEMKSRFISMISHEYRTPLTIILTSTYILEQLAADVEDDMFGRNIEKIRKTVSNMTKLLDDILAINKAESNILTMNITQISMNDIIESIISELTSSDEINRNFIVEYSPKNIFIYSDPDLVKKIIQNIISNAINFSEDNSQITISLYYKIDELIVKIKDNGIGIPSNDILKIYTPFYRCENVGQVSGAGLGMTIAKKALEKMQGDISVQSIIGKGTEVTVYLPDKKNVD